MRTFYLGTHETSWLGKLDVPLFVSHRRLARIKSRFPVARTNWALDSGGFTELGKYGTWRTTVTEYVEAVHRYQEHIGQLDWAAPMDWMCEPIMLEKTGLTIREHQERTVANYLEIHNQGPFIPVLQGWTYDDYVACVGLYSEAKVNLWALPLVGVGSVCKRQATPEIHDLLSSLHRSGLMLHGFGVKKEGLAICRDKLVSADSMAWSTRGRQAWQHDRRLMCGNHPEHSGGRSCANCSAWAQIWRDEVLAMRPPPLPVFVLDPQLELFA